MDIASTMTLASADTFGELLERHRGIVFKVSGSYARHPEDRAELMQEIAAQLWRAWPDYDPARSFSTWMYRIAINTAISHVRSNQAQYRSVPLDDHAATLADDAPSIPEVVDRVRLLRAFMDVLDPLQRALLLLYLEERSTREIAQVLGLAESTVTTRVGRLKQRLRDFANPTGKEDQDGHHHGTR